MTMELMNEILKLGIEDIEKIFDYKNRYKISYEIYTIPSEKNGLILEDEKEMKKAKYKWKIRKSTRMNFRIFHNFTNGISKQDKEILKRILYIPRGIDFGKFVRRGIDEDLIFNILVLLHEIGHIKDLIIDMYENKYLKKHNICSLQYLAFTMTQGLLHSRLEQMTHYRRLTREQYADDFSINFFLENEKKIYTLIKEFA